MDTETVTERISRQTYRWSLWLLSVGVMVSIAIAAGFLGAQINERIYASFPTQVHRATLLTPEVPAGGKRELKRVVFRQKLCHTTVDRHFIDSAGRRYDPGATVYPNGTGRLGWDRFIDLADIPADMTIGTAREINSVCYRCNWLYFLFPLCPPPTERNFTVLPAIKPVVP
jgi:hypothetical protein